MYVSQVKFAMEVKIRNVVLICCVTFVILTVTGVAGVLISNLNEACYRCLCHVSTRCDTSHGCTKGYCGPFNISKVYWVDAGKPTFPDDDPERNHDDLSAWEDCSRAYHCAKIIIEGYLQRFGKDCNADGVTDCFDYMMINGNGGYGCTASLNRSANGRRWLERFEECRHSL